MKTISKKIISLSVFGIILFVFAFIPTTYIFAQNPPGPTDYIPLVPLPGSGATTNLEDYLPRAFNLAVGIAVAMAFVAITFGGVMYATSDAMSGKSQGREYIENAIWGLLLVIGSFVILQTINPEILNFNLAIKNVVVNEPSATTYAPKPCCTVKNGILEGYTLTPAEIQEDVRIRAFLLGPNKDGVSVNNPVCSLGGTKGCTNVVHLPQTALNNIISLKSACDQVSASRGDRCIVTITGGTEGGHATHRKNLPIFDLYPSPTLNAYFSTLPNAKQAINPVSGTTVNLPGGGVAKYENAGDFGRSTGAHWHVQY